MAGFGIDQPFTGPSFPYESFDGSLIIDYDPDNITNDNVTAFVGDPVNMGFGAGGGGTAGILSIALSGDTLVLGGIGNFATVSVELTGDPGPLTPGGLPETLDGFLGQWAQVEGGISPPGANGFFFVGVAGAGAPEPSSLLMLALGFGGISLSRIVRTKRRARPRQRGEQPLACAERRSQPCDCPV